MILFSTFFICELSAQSPSFTWLGTLGGNSSHAYSVSADGSIVVGVSTTAQYRERAFRWMAGSMENLGTLGGDQSVATGISGDGSVIVGWSLDANNIKHAFKWTSDNGMQDLDAGDYTQAVGVSYDGSVIVVNNGMDGFAYRLTSGGLKNIGTLGGNQSVAYDISDDGSVIVGFSYDSSGDPYAFRWTEDSIMKIGTYYSFARGVSGDGNTVTGSETGAAGLHRAFRWTESNGFEFNIAGNFTYGLAVSGNGDVIVGDGDGAFRLTDGGGLENLALIYSDLLDAGSELYDAVDISPDGLFIVGNGKNSLTGLDEGYLIAVNGITAIENLNKIPDDLGTLLNYPNPFILSTTIEISLPKESNISLVIYNSLGEKVQTLISNELKSAGKHKICWTPGNLASGIYLCRLETETGFKTIKMWHLK